MSKEHARKFHDRLHTDKALRDEIKGVWGQIEKIAKKQGFQFDHSEYYDVLHEASGMTKVGKSDTQDDTDTCLPFLSEPPRY
jgi:hypothetical protein